MNMTDRAIELGMTVRDIVTGFSGLAVGRIENLFGGPEIKIQPKDVDDSGKPKEPIWFEESRIEVVI